MLKAVSQLLLTISLLTNVSHGLTITKSEKYAPSIFPSTAYHIEEDVENPEQLIVATFQSLGTLQYGGQLETFVGRGRAGYSEGQGSSALFNMTSSFYQINSTHIIVVDKRNHCLRWVNRLTNSTSLFAGKCTSSGFGDGQATEARFNEPNTIVSPYKNGTYYLTDSKNYAVRVLRVLEDHQSVVIETIIQNDHLLNNVKSLAVYLNNYMLVSAASHLLQVTGNTIMTLEEFDEDIEYLYSLSTENLLLVVDYEGIYQLNLLNLQGDTVWNPSLGGSCSGEKPHSVSLSTRRDQLYVGYQDCVEVLTLKEAIPQYTVPTEVTTKTSHPMPKTSPVLPGVRPIVEPDSTSKDPPDKIVFSFDGWTSYAVVALVVVVVLLITVLLAIVVRRRRRRAARNRIPRGRPPPPPPNIEIPVYEEAIPQHPVADLEDEESRSLVSSASQISPYAIGYRCTSSKPPQNIDDNITCSSEEINCFLSPNRVSQPCMEEAKNDFLTT